MQLILRQRREIHLLLVISFRHTVKTISPLILWQRIWRHAASFEFSVEQEQDVLQQWCLDSKMYLILNLRGIVWIQPSHYCVFFFFFLFVFTSNYFCKLCSNLAFDMSALIWTITFCFCNFLLFKTVKIFLHRSTFIFFKKLIISKSASA